MANTAVVCHLPQHKLQGPDWYRWCRPSGCTHGQSVETNGLLEDHLVARFVNMDYLSFSLVVVVFCLFCSSCRCHCCKNLEALEGRSLGTSGIMTLISWPIECRKFMWVQQTHLQ